LPPQDNLIIIKNFMEPQKNRIKVSILDDSKSYRDSLKRILSEDDRITIYNEYDSGKAFVMDLESMFKPDVCLIDVVLKDMSGIDCARRIKEKKEDIRIVIMTAYPDANSFSEARKIGADYVEKGPRLESLIDQIVTTSVNEQEETLISLKKDSQLKIRHIDLLNELNALEKRAGELSENQITALKLKKSGKTVKEIAKIMGVEPGTVHTHLKRASKKLNLPDLLDYIME
jgi:DNA-binding NarL/FixJ family response regulator